MRLPSAYHFAGLLFALATLPLPASAQQPKASTTLGFSVVVTAPAPRQPLAQILPGNTNSATILLPKQNENSRIVTSLRSSDGTIPLTLKQHPSPASPGLLQLDCSECTALSTSTSVLEIRIEQY